MYKLESILENEIIKILWDFEIHTDHLIPARKLSLVLIKRKKRTYHQVDFAILVNHRLKVKESKKIDKHLDLVGEQKKLEAWGWW